MPQFPLEVIEHIIDYFHNSRSNLRTCALVCKAWVAPSRYHLFHTVKVGPHVSARRRVYRAIRKSPSLAVYIREFFLSFLDRKAGKIALELLPLSTSLRNLGLFNTNWTSLEPEIRNSIRRALALPTLTRLELIDVTFDKREHFEDLLRPHLRRLVVIGLVWRDPVMAPGCRVVDEEIKQDRQQPCHLEYLTHDADSAFIDQFPGAQTTIDVTSLHTLCVTHVTATRLGDLSLMFQGLGSLKHLHLRYLPICMQSFYLSRFILTCATDAYNLNLGHIPNLTTVHIYSFQEKVASSIVPLLSSLHAPRLRKVGFIFCFSDFDKIIWSEWLEVDKILRSQAFRSIRKVKISYTCSLGLSEMFHLKLIESFPLLHSRQMLHIEYTKGYTN
jgi:hypothetical protein